MRSPTTPTYPCQECPLRQREEIFKHVTDDELDFIASFKSGELAVEAGSTILSEGANSAHVYTVLTGWGFRYKELADGRRQILNFVFPGDLIGLQGAVADEMQHSVEALSDMLLCSFERARLWNLFRKQPMLAYDITWLAAREEMLLDENLLSVGRRSARERTAFLVLHLFARARNIGLTDRNAMPMPLNQQHIADTLGLSLVHTNKTLRDLQRQELFLLRDRRLRILDRPRLEAVARWHDDAGSYGLRPMI